MKTILLLLLLASCATLKTVPEACVDACQLFGEEVGFGRDAGTPPVMLSVPSKVAPACMCVPLRERP